MSTAVATLNRLFAWKIRGVRWIEIIGVLLVAAMVFSVYLAGLWPSARGPLFAISAVYAVLAGQFLLQPKAPAPVATPAATAAATESAAAAPDVAPAPTSAQQAFAGSEAPSGEPASAPEAAAPAASANVSRDGVKPVPGLHPGRPGPDPWHAKAEKLFNARDYQALLGHATEWTQQAPRNKNAWLYLGLAHEYQKRYAEAVAANRQAHALDPDDTLILRNLGNTLINAGEFRLAADMLELGLEREPDSYRMLNDYGYAMSRMGEFDEAVAALERAVAIEPSYTRAWQNLSDTYQRAGYIDKAREITARANARR